MKYGIKLWSTNNDLYMDVVEFYNKDQFDYLELTYIPNQIEGVEVLIENNIPVLVHAPTFNQGVCFSDEKFEENGRILKDVLEFAESLNSKEVIIHPGVGTQENFINFLKGHQDSRLFIENMPRGGMNSTMCLGHKIDEIRGFLGSGPFSFCLDVAHATKAAISQGLNYKEYIPEFFELKPKILHISDGMLSNGDDEHLNLGEGEIDLVFVKDLIKESSVGKITFEVPKKNGIENDLTNIKYFRGL